jgi:NADH-quinone oxidoreductase subunit G
MSKQVTLTIDRKQVTVPEGTGLADAAKLVDIDIPVFCHHPKLEPVGMCRMCLVEIGRPMRDRATGQFVMENGAPKIQFMPKLETACTNKVEEGMVVLTERESAKARDGQKGTVEFLLTSHPLDCPICDKGGECPLQNLTMAHGPGKSRFVFDEKLRLGKHVPLGDLIFLDQERCIQCARCIRFQDEIVGDSVIGFDERARSTKIVSFSDPGFDSIFSGNTTDICPVGALTTADFRFEARPWELGSQASICTQCPVGCNITLNTRREARANGDIVVKRVMPRQNEEVNEIWICDKGRFAHHYTDSKKRLTEPLIRKDNKLTRASWADATKLAAENFLKAEKDFVILASGRLANEDLFNLKSLAERSDGSVYLYSHMAGGELTSLVGVSEGTNFGTMGAGTTIVVVASDLYQEAPIWYLRIKQAAERGATLIVMTPRETKLDRHASHVVRYAYGDEVKAVQDLGKTGQIGDAFTKAENAVILFGSDGLGISGSASLASACANLLQETGHVGKPNNGLIGVWERANDQGAWEMGFKVEDPSTRGAMPYRAEPQSGQGLAALLKGKSVYIVGADPVADDPKLAQALEGAAFVAVQDVMETATTEIADVVLPAQAFTERDGTLTSGERRIQRFYPAVPATGASQPDFAITSQIAAHMGIALEGSSASDAFEALAKSVKSFEGLNYAKLSEVRPQWPIVGRGDLYYGGTTYENTQGLGAHLSAAATRGETVSLPKVNATQGAALQRPKENELLAVPVTKLYDRGTTVMMSANLLRDWIGGPTISLHPDVAQNLGVEAGQLVTVSFDGVSGDAVVKLDDTIAVGVALIPRSMGLAIREPVVVKVKS